MAADDAERIASNKEDVSNNLLSLLPKFELKFPPFLRLPKAGPTAADNEEEARKKADVVRFAEPKPLTPPSVKLEVEESGFSHPLAIYPVYALGAFFILNWVWARWKERKERAKKNDDNQSADEYQSPVEDEND